MFGGGFTAICDRGLYRALRAAIALILRWTGMRWAMHAPVGQRPMVVVCPRHDVRALSPESRLSLPSMATLASRLVGGRTGSQEETNARPFVLYVDERSPDRITVSACADLELVSAPNDPLM